ncbi:hypothetical protein NECAME_05006 [Necator americanus]|uniref:Uncharacterized protein n=1 Tax=Necator americanus TaxID=51031 RepID=W2SKN9_NECAM|nr:hypothetical protein NECAME_05006 [Necator americanus]ETN70185.1 hypothetical protein NECAME_05006 [Necator americanus]
MFKTNFFFENLFELTCTNNRKNFKYSMIEVKRYKSRSQEDHLKI